MNSVIHKNRAQTQCIYCAVLNIFQKSFFMDFLFIFTRGLDSHVLAVLHSQTKEWALSYFHPSIHPYLNFLNQATIPKQTPIILDLKSIPLWLPLKHASKHQEKKKNREPGAGRAGQSWQADAESYHIPSHNAL